MSSVKVWLRTNDYGYIADLIDTIEAEWRDEGKKSRRNWWDILAGDKNGQPRVVKGRKFPVLQEARTRQYNINHPIEIGGTPSGTTGADTRDESSVAEAPAKASSIDQLLETLKTQPSETLESETVEFKEYRDSKALLNSKDLAQELCAFANLGGGKVIVGIRDSSNVNGDEPWESQLVGFPDGDCLELQERLRGKLNPKIPVQCREHHFEQKRFLVIQVGQSRDTVVSTSGGKYCIRDGRSSRPMQPEEVEAAIKGLLKYDWTGEPLDVTASEVLDPDVVSAAKKEFAELRELRTLPSDEHFLESIQATRNGVLLTAGLLFLGRTEAIREHLGYYEFRFTWRNRGGNLKLNEIWSSCLWKAIHRAKEYFRQCNSVFRITFNDQEIEAPLLDSLAFHEAFLNAVVHRDYTMDGMVAVTFAERRLMITSPGGFYGGVTAENIATHEPRHRNKVLANCLMSYQYVDRAGQGVMRMGLRSLMYGRRFPVFTELDDSVQVTMQAEYLRPAVFAISMSTDSEYELAELVVLNLCAEHGYVNVKELEKRVSGVARDPWAALEDAVERMEYIEFCGTRDGVFVRVRSRYESFFGVQKRLRLYSASDKYVRLYRYLRRYGNATNSDLTPLLDYRHSSATSDFLKNATWVRRSGRGRAAKL